MRKHESLASNTSHPVKVHARQVRLYNENKRVVIVAITYNELPIPPWSPLPKNFGKGGKRSENRGPQVIFPVDPCFPVGLRAIVAK
jgi:hypothetical protein